MFIDEAHTALGIFPVFFPLHAAYSDLRHFFTDMKVDVLSLKVNTAELVITFLHCLAFRIVIWYDISLFDFVTIWLLGGLDS